MTIFQDMFSFVLSVIGYIVPINKKLYCFNSLPDISDNAYAIFLELNKRRGLTLVWIVENLYNSQNFEIETTNNNIIFVKKKSIMALWYFLRAKMVVVTHSIYCSYKNYRKQKIILNTGHGMPLKKIGRLDGHSWVPNLDYTISSSPLFQEIMAKCYGVHKSQVLVTGSPKSDLLFLKTNFYENHGINKNDYNRIGVWLPTFRSTCMVFNRTDGIFDENKLSILRLNELSSFNDFLRHNKVLLIIKLHPMDILQEKDFEQYSNLRILKQNDMKEQLYPFLGSADFLLTDYSSVWIDFDILNKPIGFVVDDFEKYSNDRGFTTSLENVFPNDIIDNIEDLKKYILNPTKIKKNIYNSFKDNYSASRVLEQLGI